MRLALSSMLCMLALQLPAQFSTGQLQASFGYGIHNAYAKRFNRAIDDFNRQRYPTAISENLGNLNWLTGFEGGATYDINEDFRLHATLRSRRQFLEAPYTAIPERIQYLFRAHTLDAGADMRLSTEGRFSHYVGGGLLVGVLGVFTNLSTEPGYPGSRDMINIDHTAILGLALNYEAQFKLHDHLSLYIRPSAQFALNSHVRKLTDFFDPRFGREGLFYGEGIDEKNDSGGLNGVGVTGGVMVRLPEL